MSNFHVTIDLKGPHIYSQRKKTQLSRIQIKCKYRIQPKSESKFGSDSSSLPQRFLKLYDQLSKALGSGFSWPVSVLSKALSSFSKAYQFSKAWYLHLKASIEPSQFELADAPFSGLTLMSLKTPFLIFSLTNVRLVQSAGGVVHWSRSIIEWSSDNLIVGDFGFQFSSEASDMPDSDSCLHVSKNLW